MPIRRSARCRCAQGRREGHRCSASGVDASGFSLLRALAGNIAAAAGVAFGLVTGWCNDCGAWMAGAVPHPCRRRRSIPGLGARTMLVDATLSAPVGRRTGNGRGDRAATTAMKGHPDGVDQLCLAVDARARRHPVADSDFRRDLGTFVSFEGAAQSFAGRVAAARGEARPAWKVLRVLGNLTDLDGFDYADSSEVRDEVLAPVRNSRLTTAVGVVRTRRRVAPSGDWERIGGGADVFH